MKTNAYLRTLFIFLALFTLLTACKVKNPDYGPLATTVAGQMEAVQLLGAKDLQTAAPALWAINTATTVITPGTFMVVNQAKDVAVFVAQGGAASNGSPYTFIGFVNVTHNYIIDPAEAMGDLGIDFSQIKSLNELKTILRNNGFDELTEKTAPTLLATIRLAMGYLKTLGVGISTTLGSTISDVLVVPAGILTPEYFSPWCQAGNGCQYIEQ